VTVLQPHTVRPAASRAAVTERPGRIALCDFDVGDVAAGAVLMRVSLSGVCGVPTSTPSAASRNSTPVHPTSGTSITR